MSNYHATPLQSKGFAEFKLPKDGYMQSGPEKCTTFNAQSFVQPYAVEPLGFHRNAQKRSLHTSQCKIYIS